MTSAFASPRESLSPSLSQNTSSSVFSCTAVIPIRHRGEGKGGAEAARKGSLCPKCGSEAVQLPLPLKPRWYGPAMCQGYLNERGMTAASADSWQEPGRGERGE